MSQEDFWKFPFCNHCSKHALFYCGKCYEAAYCSAECQAADWAEHEAECGRLGGVGPRAYTTRQRSMIYARGGHITKGGHARGPHGEKFRWPSKASLRSWKRSNR